MARETTSQNPRIAELRRHSRQLVRELGFMRPTLADSDLSPSAVHAIIEIGIEPGLAAGDLAGRLHLDKSSTSRQLARLESQGLLRREPNGNDARSSRLVLSDAGQALLARIDAFANEQIVRAFRQLTPGEQAALVRSLSRYVSALSIDNPNGQVDASVDPDAQIRCDYLPGCIGDVAALHGRYYARHSGFGAFFEHKVASELGAFVQSLPAPGKRLWLHAENGRTLASVAVDDDVAEATPIDGTVTGLGHLRWFIVDESLQGLGIGRRLLEHAISFADERFAATYLWTFAGLDAARHLYESVGFHLVEELDGKQWGKLVKEQRFVRRSTSVALGGIY